LDYQTKTTGYPGCSGAPHAGARTSARQVIGQTRYRADGRHPHPAPGPFPTGGRYGSLGDPAQRLATMAMASQSEIPPRRRCVLWPHHKVGSDHALRMPAPAAPLCARREGPRGCQKISKARWIERASGVVKGTPQPKNKGRGMRSTVGKSDHASAVW